MKGRAGMEMNEKTRENRIRRIAKRCGYIVKKSRSRYVYPQNLDNYGGYMIVDEQYNALITG